MNGILRNFPVIKVICHIILIAIWIYWGTCIHPLTTGWIEWIILVGIGSNWNGTNTAPITIAYAKIN